MGDAGFEVKRVEGHFEFFFQAPETGEADSGRVEVIFSVCIRVSNVHWAEFIQTKSLPSFLIMSTKSSCTKSADVAIASSGVAIASSQLIAWK